MTCADAFAGKDLHVFSIIIFILQALVLRPSIAQSHHGVRTSHVGTFTMDTSQLLRLAPHVFVLHFPQKISVGLRTKFVI